MLTPLSGKRYAINMAHLAQPCYGKGKYLLPVLPQTRNVDLPPGHLVFVAEGLNAVFLEPSQLTTLYFTGSLALFLMLYYNF